MGMVGDASDTRAVEVVEVDGQKSQVVGDGVYCRFTIWELLEGQVVMLMVDLPEQTMGAEIGLGLDAKELLEGIWMVWAKLFGRRGCSGIFVVADD